MRLASIFAALVLTAACGCARDPGEPSGKLEKVWGKRGLEFGNLQAPRAMVADADDRLYIVDKTGRIQIFTREGDYVRGWRTPEIKYGKPVGLGLANDGSLIVADTHYYRVLFYTPEGDPLPERTLGGTSGRGPGEFNWVTDVVQDSHGNYYVGEYGDFDRIQKFSPTGEFLMQWGTHGHEPGEFVRPQGLTIDEHDHVWIADACNHRIQVFDATGDEAKLVRIWGEQGYAPGRLRYPYGILLDGDGHVYISEFGNNRVQKFTIEGEPRGFWGRPGRREGELHQPWAIAQDSRGRIHVLDTQNHRVQRIRL